MGELINSIIWCVGMFVITVGIATGLAIVWEKTEAKRKAKKAAPAPQVKKAEPVQKPVHYERPVVYSAPKRDDFCWENPYIKGTVRYMDWEKRYGDSK